MKKGFLCSIGLHAWVDIPNTHGGRPMRKRCKACGDRMCWDYDQAREHGRIVWVKEQSQKETSK